MPIWCHKTKSDLKDLVSIEYKFLRYASSKSPNPMHFFEHDHNQIRSLLKIESVRSKIKKIDYSVSFEIANKQYNSLEVKNLFSPFMHDFGDFSLYF